MSDEEINKLIESLRNGNVILYILGLDKFTYGECLVKRVVPGNAVAYEGEPEPGLCAKLNHRTAYVHLPDADILNFRVVECL